jgi:hypothetical protein
MVVTRSGSWIAKGVATITIYDQGGSPVSGATVYADYTGPNSGSVSGNTNANGEVTLQSAYRFRPSGEWCFEVTDVTKSDWTYDPGANLVTKACESGWVYDAGGEMLADALPQAYGLGQNYPNPFNPTTEIAFALPEAAHVTLEIYNVLGQRVATLVDDFREAGTYTVNWDASSQSSGIYLYRLQTGQFIETRKMILLK